VFGRSTLKSSLGDVRSLSAAGPSNVLGPSDAIWQRKRLHGGNTLFLVDCRINSNILAVFLPAEIQ